MKKIISAIMNAFNKFLQWLGIKKKEERKVSSFDGITPMPHLKKDEINVDQFEEEVKESEELDELNEKIIKNIPEINISPIPNLDKDKIDIDQFDEEVKKSNHSEESHKKVTENIPQINIDPVPSIPVDKVKVKKPKKTPVKKTKSTNKKKETKTNEK